jgi:hypothetical protein
METHYMSMMIVLPASHLGVDAAAFRDAHQRPTLDLLAPPTPLGRLLAWSFRRDNGGCSLP